MLAAEREKEEGGWPGGGGIIVCVCLHMRSWGIWKLYCMHACVCCLTQHVCQCMMSVVSVSTTEGGVTADVLPLS